MNGKGQGWMGSGNLVKTFRYFTLRLTCSRKRLAAGLRPDPLGEHRRFSRPLTVVGGQGMENYLSVVMGTVWRTERAG